MGSAEDQIRAAMAERGPISYSELIEIALYDEQAGFYSTGGRAGRRSDFITSPEVGPLFGAVIARALDAWWDEAGQPGEWTVVEAGAGPGTLARMVLAAAPRCAGALRYVLVERAAAQRAMHAALVERQYGSVESRAELPPPSGRPTVVLANELLDNLPFDLLERTADGWAEVRVGVEDERLVEVRVPFDRPPPVDPSGVPERARVPVQEPAEAWLRAALAVAGAGGRVVVFDYASTTAAVASRPQGEWLRTYRGHTRGGPPLDGLGEQDITCEVCVDQLARVAIPSEDRSQAEWLRRHGVDDLVAEGRRTWEERAHLGDLEAVRGRSRITEAEALLDPSGLGAFRALEWTDLTQR